MKKSLLVLIWLLWNILNLSHAQGDSEDLYFQKYSPDSLRLWTIELMEEVSRSQPGMYRYTSKQEFDHIIDSTLATIRDSLSTLTYYRKLKPLFAKIGCLHTSISLSEAYEDVINDSMRFIPIEVFINEKRQVFVTKNYSESGNIPIRSEILSINGQAISEILSILYQAIPSDGYNQTLKTRILNKQFSFWYRNMISDQNIFEIRAKIVNSIKTYRLEGVAKQIFPTDEELEKSQGKQLQLAINDGIGVLTIHSFAKSLIKGNGQKFDKFIKSAFKELSEKQVEHLIIDLRGNAGGSDGNAVKLASYFFNQPFQYWEKIEMTPYIAEQIKGLPRIFYKKPIKKDSTFHWQGARWWFSKEFDYYKGQKPAKNSYKGKLYVLTDGLCMSSCADFVAILSHNDKVKVIGQETGGGYQGNTSGLIPETPIYANLEMTIPLLKYTNAVDINTNFGRGTIPDFIVSPSLNDWIDEKDVVLVFAKKLIRQLNK